VDCIHFAKDTVNPNEFLIFLMNVMFPAHLIVNVRALTVSGKGQYIRKMMLHTCVKQVWF